MNCIEKVKKIITLNNFHSILTAKITKNSNSVNLIFLTNVHLIERSDQFR